jgi:hypothetical protein
MLRDNGERTGASTPGGTRNQQKGIGIHKALAGSYRFDYLIAVLFGNLSAQFVDFAHAMTARFPATNEDAVLVIWLDSGQATEVSNVSIDGEGIGDDVDAALNMCSAVQSGKFIGDSTATLPKTNYN